MRTSAPGLPDAVAGLTAEPLWWRFDGGDVTASTNDDCRALAAGGVAEGAVVVALEQTAGRGRLGRTWHSPRGGVYLSVLLRPAVAAADAGPLPLVAGLGVAYGLETLGASVELKWPNDVLASRGKVAGILLESAVAGGSLEWVVAGCGIDVARPESGTAPGAAYLDEILGRPTSPDRVAASVLDGIARAYSDFTARGFAPMLGEYERRSALAGRAVTVADAAGAEVASGTVAGVDASGSLVVETAAGVVSVLAGDVTLRIPD